MVGIVIVSHSRRIAEAVVELARAFAGDAVPIEAAGGGTGARFGVDPAAVRDAVVRAGRTGDVLVLMDLGSAVPAAELARASAGHGIRGRVELCEAPLVEGAITAAVAAGIGATIEEVAAQARTGLDAKAARIGTPPGAPPVAAAGPDGGEWRECHLVVTNAVGLHARPAARLVQVAAGFDAEVTVQNASTGAGPVSARSLTDVQTLGAMMGHQILVRARGPQAAEALDALRALAARSFDDHATPVPAPVFLTAAAATGPNVIRGRPGAPGVVVGEARRLRRTPIRSGAGTGDPAIERSRLDGAFAQARSELRVARDAVAAQAGEEHAAIMDAQLLMLEDDAIIAPARAAIAAGRDAAAALRDAVEAAAGRIDTLPDGYQRARGEDIRQVGRLVAEHLAGVAGPPRLRGRGILIAPDLSPAETAVLDLTMVEGIVIAGGGPTSHTAIIARGLGIPAVVGAGDMAMTIVEETPLLVDGDAGTVTIDPDGTLVERALRDAATHERPAPTGRGGSTRDGTPVVVLANVASVSEVRDAAARGADGVGLFRTEFLYMNRPEPPGEDEQERAYRQAAEALDGRRLVLRTVDAGDDKPVPFLPGSAEGMRGIRLALAHPEILRTQLRAALRVAADHPVAVMFPMIGDPGDLDAASAELDVARAELDAAGVRRGDVEVGVMIEVPSAALLAGELAARAAFLSIGTNDLTRYTLGIGRDEHAGDAYRGGLHPAVRELVAMASRAGHERGIRVGVCGEAACDPLAVPDLLALGIRELSVAGPLIQRTRAIVAEVDLAAAD